MAFIQSAFQSHEHMCCIFRIGLSGKGKTPNVSALPMELIKITRLQMLPKLVLAALFASAPPLCSPHASPCIFSSSMDLCGHFRYFGGQFSGSASLPVWICSCLLPLLSCMDPDPPDWMVQLSVAPPSSCVDLHSDWFVQLSLVLDLTMWPRLLWHHMVPSSARDRRAHAHLPLPANHAPWSKKNLEAKHSCMSAALSCVGFLIHGTITVVNQTSIHCQSVLPVNNQLLFCFWGDLKPCGVFLCLSVKSLFVFRVESQSKCWSSVTLQIVRYLRPFLASLQFSFSLFHIRSPASTNFFDHWWKTPQGASK